MPCLTNSKSKAPTSKQKCLSCIGLVLAILNVVFPSYASATTVATESATVSATVPTVGPPPGDDTIPPDSPILIRPVDGSATSDPTPEFVWRRVTDPNSNNVKYTVYIDGTASYLGVIDTANSSGTDYVSTIDGNEIRLIPTRGLPDGIHKWKVAAYDLANNTSFSTEWTLIIDTHAPPITITDIDTHHNLNLSTTNPASIPEDTTFEITGPKDVYFTIKTEVYATVRLTLTGDNTTIHTTGQTQGGDIIQLYTHLEIGRYIVTVSATDRGNNTTVLPSFTLNVTQALIVIPIPGVSPPPSIAVPRQLTELSSFLYNYPATISRISTRPSIALLYVGLIALIVLILIILLKKRYNVLLISPHGTPIGYATITLPHVDKQYTVDEKDGGRAYIPQLELHAELSIEVSGITHHLCLSRAARIHKITL